MACDVEDMVLPAGYVMHWNKQKQCLKTQLIIGDIHINEHVTNTKKANNMAKSAHYKCTHQVAAQPQARIKALVYKHWLEDPLCQPTDFRPKVHQYVYDWEHKGTMSTSWLGDSLSIFPSLHKMWNFNSL